jgi:hypothetical protein
MQPFVGSLCRREMGRRIDRIMFNRTLATAIFALLTITVLARPATITCDCNAVPKKQPSFWQFTQFDGESVSGSLLWNALTSTPTAWNNAGPRLSRCDFAVPISACWNGCVLVNQLPFALPPLEAIRFTHDEAFRIPGLENDIHLLDRGYKAHVAIHDDIRFEDVNFAQLKTAKRPASLLTARHVDVST